MLGSGIKCCNCGSGTVCVCVFVCACVSPANAPNFMLPATRGSLSHVFRNVIAGGSSGVFVCATERRESERARQKWNTARQKWNSARQKWNGRGVPQDIKSLHPARFIAPRRSLHSKRCRITNTIDPSKPAHTPKRHFGPPKRTGTGKRTHHTVPGV